MGCEIGRIRPTNVFERAGDAAYILSADGDFTPAVQAVRAHGKKVYAVSTLPGAQLASVVNSFVRVPAVWFDDCYGGMDWTK